MVSHPGRGVAAITSTMVNITRIHNSVSAVANIRRIVALSRDYAHRRTAFGARLSDNPLHLETLASLELTARAQLHFTLDTVKLLGLVEAEQASEGGGDSGSHRLSRNALLLRLLTPLLKVYTAKAAIAAASEGLENFGGNGYIEDTGLPVLLRDSQVLPIWEGTTNVLSHDTLRVLAQRGGASVGEFFRVLLWRAEQAEQAEPVGNEGRLAECGRALKDVVEALRIFVGVAFRPDKRRFLEAKARRLTYSLARAYAASCLVEHAVWSRDPLDLAAAWRYCKHRPAPDPSPGDSLVDSELAVPASPALYEAETRALALDVAGDSGRPRGMGDFHLDGSPRSKF